MISVHGHDSTKDRHPRQVALEPGASVREETKGCGHISYAHACPSIVGGSPGHLAGGASTLQTGRVSGLGTLLLPSRLSALARQPICMDTRSHAPARQA